MENKIIIEKVNEMLKGKSLIERFAILEMLQNQNMKSEEKKTKVKNVSSKKQDLALIKKFRKNNKIRPILNYAKIEAETITATNLENSIIIQSNNFKDAEGGMYDVQKLQKEITGKETLQNIEDFPDIEKVYTCSWDESDNTIVWNTKELHNALEKVIFSAGVMKESVEINCVRIEAKNNQLHFVATNRYRIAKTSVDFNSEDFSMSINLEGLKNIMADLKCFDLPIKILNSGNKVIIEYSNRKIILKNIDLPFVDYESIIDNVYKENEVLINRIEFLELLKKHLEIVKSNEETKNCSILEFFDSRIHMRSINSDFKLEDKIDFIAPKDFDLKILLNIKHIIDFLKISKDDNIKIELNNNRSAVFFTDTKITYLVMPLAIRDVI